MIPGTTQSPASGRGEARLILALYGLEFGVAAFAIAVLKYHDRLSILNGRQAGVLLGSLGLALGSAAVLVQRAIRARATGWRPVTFAVATNLVALALMLAIGEVGVRLLAVRTDTGLAFAGTPLLPKRWEETVGRNARLLSSAPPPTAYFVGDTLLGWTVGPARQSKDGMYRSSVEGIRSPVAGMSYAAITEPRIAIVGDSYTFGFDGPFEDSWGAQLDSALGRAAVVLNFGVDGYGVDQAWLRYLRDARPWHPKVTIFGFIHHDLYRTLSAYTFITFPEWGYPFSKPRFVLEQGQPRLVNVPLISADSILTLAAVTDLPFLGLEVGYDPAEWEWHASYRSYLMRYLASRFRRYPLARPEVDDRTLQTLNTALLMEFVRTASAGGTIPLVSYFPGRRDLQGEDVSAKDSVLAALGRSGVRSIDLTSCLRAVGIERGFIPGRPHYSAAGNAAVARCLEPAVERALAGAPPT